MTSTSKGRAIGTGLLTVRSLRDPTFQEGINGGTGAWANDYFWGGYPRDPVRIPYAWLSPPAHFRPDQARNVATITRAGGAPARYADRASVASTLGERPFTAGIDSAVIDDPYNLATWVVNNYLQPRQRNPSLGLILNARTPVECWRILGREIGDRISITDTPGSPQQLVGNPWFETGTAGWTPTGCVLSQSATWSRSGSNSLLITPDGVTGAVFAEDAPRRVIAGADYVADGWLHCPGGYSAVGLAVNWYTAASTFLSTSSTMASIGAAFTSHRTNIFTAPAGAYYGRAAVLLTGTPAPSNTLLADEVMLTGPDGTVPPWPSGASELVIEGIANAVRGAERWVVWNTAPLIGASPGEVGPWFRADQSKTNSGTDVLAW